MSYRLTQTERFDTRLDDLEDEVAERIVTKLKEFRKQVNDYGINPRQHNNTKFIADKRTWWLRIGDYRAFFDIFEGELKFTTVLHRSDAYK